MIGYSKETISGEDAIQSKSEHAGTWGEEPSYMYLSI